MNNDNCNCVDKRTLKERQTEYEVGYERGFDEGAWAVWEWCEHYLVAKEDGGTIPVDKLRELFNVEHFGEILANYDPFTAMAMVDMLEVHVGDVGTIHMDDEDQVVVVMRISEFEGKRLVHCMTRDGGIVGCAENYFKPLCKHVNLEEFFGDDEIWSAES